MLNLADIFPNRLATRVRLFLADDGRFLQARIPGEDSWRFLFPSDPIAMLKRQLADTAMPNLRPGVACDA